MDDKFNKLDTIVNCYWDSLPEEMKIELKKFYCEEDKGLE
tara:strand:- start:1574 stop:1693 length:120 start_codon:yes stop_codon:yes gene_type:complete